MRGWLTRPADPESFDKAADVCSLYRTCPPNAVVISVDEKTGITARSRKHPDLPGAPGKRTRREFEYVRHGTVSIIRRRPGHSPGHGQRFLAHLEEDPRLAGHAFALPRPPHAQTRILAEPGGAT